MEMAFNDDGLHGVAHLRNNGTFLYSTSDGGLTWTNLGQPANWKSSRITAVPGTNAYVATSVNGFDRGSSVSYDNGVTWTVIESLVPKAVTRFFDASTGYAGSFFLTGPPLRGGIYKSQIVFEVPLSENKRRVSKPGMKREDITKEALVKVYPIPANNLVNISLPAAFTKAMSVISIVNMDGKVLATRTIKAGTLMQVDVSKLSPGLYIVRIQSNTQTITKAITIAR
jgi:hypothetical protein